MAKNNKICVVCNTPYRYCNNCSDFINYPSWMSMFCSEECIDAYQIMSDFENNKISKEQAKIKLIKYIDSGKYKNYQRTFKASYEKIMGENEIEKPQEEVKEEIKVKDQTNTDIKNFNQIDKQMAIQTANVMKNNLKSEAKKFYPKAVAHKHGK